MKKKSDLFESPDYLKRKAKEPDQFRRYQKQIARMSGRKNRSLRGWARKILTQLRKLSQRMGWDPKDGRAFFSLNFDKRFRNHVEIQIGAFPLMRNTILRRKNP